MPLKNGRLTPQEAAFVDRVADHGNALIAAREAGYSAKCAQPMASKLTRNPEIQQAILARQQERLFSEVLPLAVQQHIALLQNGATPAGAKAQLIKLAYDKAGIGQPDTVDGKEPHEMSGRELDQAIAKLRAEIEARSRKTIDVTPAAQPQVGVFD